MGIVLNKYALHTQGDTTMTHAISSSAIADSLHKQFSNLNLTISHDCIKSYVDDSFRDTHCSYDEVKACNGKLHKLLLQKNIEIKRTALLNMIAKSMGYENHHSLKNSGAVMQQLFAVNTEISNFIGMDHPLSQLFFDKRGVLSFLRKNGLMLEVTTDGLSLYPHINQIILDIWHLDNEELISEIRHKFELSSVVLFEYSSTPEERLFTESTAMEIVKCFNGFFYPNIKKDMDGKFLQMEDGEAAFLSYESFSIDGDLLVVDGYSSDSYHVDIIKSAIECALLVDDNTFWITLVQILLGVPADQRLYRDTPVSEFALLAKYYERAVIIRNTIPSTYAWIERYLSDPFILNIDKENVQSYLEIEKYAKKPIGRLIKEAAVAILNDSAVDKYNPANIDLTGYLYNTIPKSIKKTVNAKKIRADLSLLGIELNRQVKLLATISSSREIAKRTRKQL